MRLTTHLPANANYVTLRTSRHFLHFPNFPSGNQRKLPKHLCTIDLYPSNLGTSHQKTRTGKRRLLSIPPSLVLSISPSRRRLGPLPLRSYPLPSHFPRFPDFPVGSSQGKRPKRC